MASKDHARNDFPFCRPIAPHLRLLLNRGILNVELLRLRFRSIVATKSTDTLEPQNREFISYMVLTCPQYRPSLRCEFVSIEFGSHRHSYRSAVTTGWHLALQRNVDTATVD